MKNNVITKELIDKAMSYQEYNSLLIDLFSKGKTTGENQSDDLLNYAKMNLQRMKRLNKTVELSDELKTVISESKKEMIWLVITEGWCGDAAQNIPVLNKIAELSSTIQMKLILRDENLEVMDEFLTNGGRSIPKLIVLDKNTLEIIDTWGPRPNPALDLINEFKAKEIEYKDFVKDVQLWYAKDKTTSMQNELAEKFKNWN